MKTTTTKTPVTKKALKPRVLKNKFKSWNKKTPDVTYSIEYNEDTNLWKCSCPHFFYRIYNKEGDGVPKWKGCKHIRGSRIVDK